MSQLVPSMATVSLPESLLDKLEVKKLIDEFNEDYKKLDSFKRAREMHESRSWLSRKLHASELEEAKLDAQELQASFSKKLGQLMAISFEQSRMLNEQQAELSRQQNIIKRQTGQLKDNAETLSHQQQKLEIQTRELNDLIQQYFELKGLTQEGAKKLILIANEVKETKDELLNKFEQKLYVIRDTEVRINDQIEAMHQQLASSLEAHAKGVREFKKQLMDELEAGQATAKELISATDKNLQSLQSAQQQLETRLSECHSQLAGQLQQQNDQWLGEHQKLVKSVDDARQQHLSDIHEIHEKLCADKQELHDEVKALEGVVKEKLTMIQRQSESDIERLNTKLTNENEQLLNRLHIQRNYTIAGFCVLTLATTVVGLVTAGLIII